MNFFPVCWCVLPKLHLFYSLFYYIIRSQCKGKSTYLRRRCLLHLHDNEFEITECHLIYFRKPQEIQFNGCIDIATGTTFTADQECEFNDDVAEVIADATAMILAGDIESITQYQREQQNVQSNS